MSLFHFFELNAGRRRKKDTGSNHLSQGSHFRSSTNTLSLSSPRHSRRASKYVIDVHQLPTSDAQQDRDEFPQVNTGNGLVCIQEEVIDENERIDQLLKGFFWTRRIEVDRNTESTGHVTLVVVLILCHIFKALQFI